VIVQVDETRAYDEVFAIDNLPGGADPGVADGDDLAIEHCHIAFVRLAAAAIDDRATLEKDVDIRRSSGAQLR
jgi:hypothetical protein